MSSWQGVPRSFWFPSPSAAFRWLLIPRLCGAFFMHISDCDETFNYWEPAHHLLYGGGFQTWEYSPTYALRSYAYLLLHIFPILATNTTNKLIAFYLLRVMLSVMCALCEVYFYRAILLKYGPKIGRLTLFLLVGSCGMYIAAPAFLPSTFAMNLGMIALGAWFQKQYELAIFSVAVSSLVGWPFSAALGLPIALDLILSQRRLLFFMMWSTLSFILVAGPLIAVDSIYYGRFVLAPWNILMYNVFGKGGPNLYGTEPWTFYFVNGFLNFNIIFILALLSVLVVEFQVFWEVVVTVIGRGTTFTQTLVNVFSTYRGTDPGSYLHVHSRGYRAALKPMLIWILVFFTRAHKEERFLFPIFPLFCLCAAITVYLLPEVSTVLLGLTKTPRPLRRLSSLLLSYLPLLTITFHTFLSLSRGWALYKGYHAPMDVYKAVNSHEILSYTEQFSGVKEVNLCVAKEWYRFPSSFFLPDRRWHLRFVQSDFKGQLPQPYGRHSNATSIIPDHMNDMNREEPSRYFPVSDCHFLVDLDLPETTPLQPRYAQDTAAWDVLVRIPFLDTSRSHRLYRAFAIPWLSHKYTSYANYVLLKNRQLFSHLKLNPLRAQSPS